MFNKIDELRDETIEAMEEEEEQFNDEAAIKIIACHILACAEELKKEGYEF